MTPRYAQHIRATIAFSSLPYAADLYWRPPSFPAFYIKPIIQSMDATLRWVIPALILFSMGFLARYYYFHGVITATPAHQARKRMPRIATVSAAQAAPTYDFMPEEHLLIWSAFCWRPPRCLRQTKHGHARKMSSKAASIHIFDDEQIYFFDACSLGWRKPFSKSLRWQSAPPAPDAMGRATALWFHDRHIGI